MTCLTLRNVKTLREGLCHEADPAEPRGRAHGGEAVSVPSLHAPFYAIRSFDQACAAPLARAAKVLASLAPGDGAVDGVGEAKQEARQQQCKQ